VHTLAIIAIFGEVVTKYCYIPVSRYFCDGRLSSGIYWSRASLVHRVSTTGGAAAYTCSRRGLCTAVVAGNEGGEAHV